MLKLPLLLFTVVNTQEVTQYKEMSSEDVSSWFEIEGTGCLRSSGVHDGADLETIMHFDEGRLKSDVGLNSVEASRVHRKLKVLKAEGFVKAKGLVTGVYSWNDFFKRAQVHTGCPRLALVHYYSTTTGGINILSWNGAVALLVPQWEMVRYSWFVLSQRQEEYGVLFPWWLAFGLQCFFGFFNTFREIKLYFDGRVGAIVFEQLGCFIFLYLVSLQGGGSISPFYGPY